MGEFVETFTYFLTIKKSSDEYSSREGKKSTKSELLKKRVSDNSNAKKSAKIITYTIKYDWNMIINWRLAGA